jgi:pimeloyl-ACP methyl ester carboxylesterase
MATRQTMKKKILWALTGLAIGALTYGLTRPEALDTRYSGAYSLPDDSFVYISPEGEDLLRFRTLSGRSGLLWRDGQHFEGGKGFAEREPAFHRFSFELNDAGHVTALEWQQPGMQAIRAARVPLQEHIVRFDSGEVRLRGKLVMPQGTGPHPAIVVVPDAEQSSAVDRHFHPYLYASRGFATLVFDQRGTGESAGGYTLNVRMLATDVLAALKWLRDQPGIEGGNVHLAGFGQGGWIAPMAAARDANVRSVLVSHGPLVSAFQEDRWRYVHQLTDRGFDAAAIVQADRINAILSDIVDKREDRWDDLRAALDAARDAPWFAVLEGGSSMLSEFAHSKLPLWALRIKVRWMLRAQPPFIDRLYDPVPTAAALDSPSYWIFGERDSTTPTQWTLEALNKLQRQRKPIDYLIYPEAAHDILRIEQMPDGQYRVLGYEPDYFKVQIDWFKRNAAPRAEPVQ